VSNEKKFDLKKIEGFIEKTKEGKFAPIEKESWEFVRIGTEPQGYDFEEDDYYYSMR